MLIAHLDRSELAYERHGKGKKMLLIHGYPLDHTIWNLLIPELEDHFDLIIPDLPGFGSSKISQPHQALAGFAADLVGLLDHLAIDRVVLAGHSMGGYIALILAVNYPQRIHGLSLVASQAVADTPEKRAMRMRSAENVGSAGMCEMAESMPALLTSDQNIQAFLKKMILRQSPTAVVGALRAMADREDWTPFLNDLDFPIEVIHGTADQLVSIARAEEAVSAAKSGRLTRVEGGGHMPMMEAPVITAQALARLQ